MQIQNTSNDPEEWQRLYLDIRAWRRALRQGILVGIPIIMILLWTGIVIQLLKPGHSLLVFVSAVIITLGILFVSNTGKTFIDSLYCPSPDENISSQIWNRLSGWQGLFKSRNYLVIKDSKLTPPDHWSTWLGGPHHLIISDGYAVYLEKGNCFSRVVGAGFPIPYLDARETIKAIVDLRPQTRAASVNAWTKDGINVSLKVRFEYQISSDPTVSSNTNAKLIYPYDPYAVKKAVEYTALRLRDGKLEDADWCDGVQGKVTGFMAHHISSHHLDELFLTSKGDGQILSDTTIQKICANLDNGLVDIGVSLKGLQITDIGLPEEVRQQRLDRWMADKDNLVSRIRGEAQAFGIRVNEVTRAKAQHDLIVTIAKSLEKVEPAQFPEPLLLSLSGLIDQNLNDPFVRTYLANETLITLKALREII